MDTQAEQIDDVEDAEVIPPNNHHEIEIISDNVASLARRGQSGIAIIQAREGIVAEAVRASVRLTHPQDWVLFRDKTSGRVTAYLQDSGCKRINRLWKIQVTKTGEERVPEGSEFAWVLRGDAYCGLTDSWEYDLEGVRYSNENFVSSVSEPLKRSIRVHQAARANLDGAAVRKLSGLGSVPQAFLDEVWKGTDKNTKDCVLGRGFGSSQERQGTNVRSEETPNISAPICDKCGTDIKFHPAGSNASGKWEAYWKCKDYSWDSKKQESNGHSRVKAADWEKQNKKNGNDAPAAGEPGHEPTQANLL